MHLIRLLLKDPCQVRDALGPVIWSMLADRARAGFVREYSARYAGRFARTGDAARLKQLLNTEADPRLRRALLVAVYECGGSTTAWLRNPMRNVSDLRMTSEYLRTAPRVPLP